MSESTRPSMQAVQKGLLFGVLIGLILGILVGIVLAYIYVVYNPPVYEGGAYPNEMTENYQSHYLAMTIDSYLVTPRLDLVAERLKTFSLTDKVVGLGERSAHYVATERGNEAQRVNELAVALKAQEGWNDSDLEQVIAELTTKYQDDPAKSQAVSSFSSALLGTVPVPAEGQAPEAPVAEAPTTAPAAEPATPGPSWPLYLMLCLLLIVILLLVVYFLGKRQFEKRKKPTKKEVEWEGEGPAPLKTWSGTYTLGQDTYDEFFTIETEDNDFLGECGMGILETVPNTSPKQVLVFDVGLFDKTDITTLSRAVMSEFAYGDETIRAKIDANPQAEAILAEPDKEFSFETSALRVDAKITEMKYAEDDNKYFEKLTVSLNLFLKEGADLRKGEMDIPDEFKISS